VSNRLKTQQFFENFLKVQSGSRIFKAQLSAYLIQQITNIIK